MLAEGHPLFDGALAKRKALAPRPRTGVRSPACSNRKWAGAFEPATATSITESSDIRRLQPLTLKRTGSFWPFSCDIVSWESTTAPPVMVCNCCMSAEVKAPR